MGFPLFPQVNPYERPAVRVAVQGAPLCPGAPRLDREDRRRSAAPHKSGRRQAPAARRLALGRPGRPPCPTDASPHRRALDRRPHRRKEVLKECPCHGRHGHAREAGAGHPPHDRGIAAGDRFPGRTGSGERSVQLQDRAVLGASSVVVCDVMDSPLVLRPAPATPPHWPTRSPRAEAALGLSRCARVRALAARAGSLCLAARSTAPGLKLRLPSRWPDWQLRRGWPRASPGESTGRDPTVVGSRSGQAV